MSSQYFLYRYKFQPLAGNSRYTPSYEFNLIFPEIEASIKDELIPEVRFKKNYKGGTTATGERIGKCESKSDMSLLLGKGNSFDIRCVSNKEATDFVRFETDLTEKEPGLFVVSEATNDLGIERPEVTLDLR